MITNNEIIFLLIASLQEHIPYFEIKRIIFKKIQGFEWNFFEKSNGYLKRLK